jgi:hypothetical protein
VLSARIHVLVDIASRFLIASFVASSGAGMSVLAHLLHHRASVDGLGDVAKTAPNRRVARRRRESALASGSVVLN